MELDRLPPARRARQLCWLAATLLLAFAIGHIPKAVGQTGDSAAPMAPGFSDPGSPDVLSLEPDQPRNLARDRYVDRQRATLQMWRLRSQSRQAVQDAARNSDPEVAERAAWILKQWRNGSLPGVGTAPNESLLDRGSPGALAAVLERGAFDAVRVAVEESAGTIEFDQIKKHVADLLTQRYPFYADKAFAEGSEPELLLLLDAVAIDRNLATAVGDLQEFLNVPTEESNPLPSAASIWTPTEQEICLAQLAMLRGDVAQSIKHATLAGDPVLLRIARMLGNQWQRIADQAFEDAPQAASLEARIEAYAWALAAASRSGNGKQVNEATERLLELQQGNLEDIGDLRWRVLAMHGQVDKAIDVLALDDPAAAARVACASSRFRRAEELCGYPLENIASDLDGWISEAYVDQAELPAGEIASSIERLYSLARLLVNIGDSENAWRIYRRLTPRQVIISQYGASLREQTLLELDLVNRFDWILDFAVAPDENGLTQRSQLIIARALNTEAESFRTVLDRIKVIFPGGDFRERFQATFQLFRGKLPDGFDPEQDFKRLFDALVHHQQLKRTGGRTFQVEEVSIDLEIIDMFIRQGQVELAREGLSTLVRAGDLDAMILSAQTNSEQGDIRAAAELWLQVARQSSEFTPTNELITLDHGLAYAKSVVGQWILAKRAGHQQEAERLESRIRLMLTSPSMSFRKDLADHLREIGQYELAIDVLRDLIVISSFGGEESPDFFRVAVTYVGVIDDLTNSNPEALTAMRVDANDSVKWSDLAVLGILKTTSYLDTAFISVPLSVQKTVLQRAMDSGDWDLARQAIDQIELIDPLNIDFGERMLPELKKAGMSELADSALDRLLDRGLQHIGYFRTDATALNNIAWTAAMNQRRLSEALELSELAVTLEPDSVVYRDTLAEVLHLLGRNKEAFAIESACLLDEPDEWHLYEQIQKYQKHLEPSN